MELKYYFCSTRATVTDVSGTVLGNLRGALNLVQSIYEIDQLGGWTELEIDDSSIISGNQRSELYIRFRRYRDEKEEADVINTFEYQERIQGVLNIFTSASEIQRRYRDNAGAGQLSFPTTLIETTKRNRLPIEAVVYSRYHIELRVYNIELRYAVFLVRLSRFLYTNLWKIFIKLKDNQKKFKRRKWLVKVNRTRRTQGICLFLRWKIVSRKNHLIANISLTTTKSAQEWFTKQIIC